MISREATLRVAEAFKFFINSELLVREPVACYLKNPSVIWFSCLARFQFSISYKNFCLAPSVFRDG